MEVWLAFGQNLSNNVPVFVLLFTLIVISFVRKEKLGISYFFMYILAFILLCLFAALFEFNLT